MVLVCTMHVGNVFFFNLKMSYEMRISDWSADVCSSDLVATAILVEDKEIAPGGHWDSLDTKLKTVFSNNIRNNFGFLNRGHGGIDQSGPTSDKLFVQEGRKVFKEVVPMVANMIVEQMEILGLEGGDMRRLWLHQANTNMNRLIAQRVLGHEAREDESPTVLDTYGNTSSAGSIIAFHLNHEDIDRKSTRQHSN